MAVSNTPTSFGSVTRTLHWLTALLILTAIPLGLAANRISPDAANIATKTMLFSFHKTVGVAAFVLGLARIFWAMTQRRPAALHPDRRAETALAAVIHWLLYISLVAVPLTGWIHHAALDGFAPILWPFGQDLPFVAKSETTAAIFGTAHWVFTKLLAVSILLHIAGALKHHFIDRDATLRRMTRGISAGSTAATQQHIAPLMAALVLYGAGAGLAYSMLPPTADVTAAPSVTASQDGNWQVSEGKLSFDIKQMGAAVTGSFATWTAEIQFDETATSGDAGQVSVSIDMASLSLGSVTSQAKSADFFDVANHSSATFTAKILPDGGAYQAVGSLILHGIEKPLTLPFSLKITGDTAEMQGQANLDRRDFGIGAGYSDEATVGFPVTVNVSLTAKRK